MAQWSALAVLGCAQFVLVLDGTVQAGLSPRQATALTDVCTRS